MKKMVEVNNIKRSRKGWKVFLTIFAFIFVLFVIFPLSKSMFNDSQNGNVAIIPIVKGSG